MRIVGTGEPCAMYLKGLNPIFRRCGGTTYVYTTSQYSFREDGKNWVQHQAQRLCQTCGWQDNTDCAWDVPRTIKTAEQWSAWWSMVLRARPATDEAAENARVAAEEERADEVEASDDDAEWASESE